MVMRCGWDLRGRSPGDMRDFFCVLALNCQKRVESASGGAGNERYGKCLNCDLPVNLTKRYTMPRAVLCGRLDSAH